MFTTAAGKKIPRPPAFARIGKALPTWRSLIRKRHLNLFAAGLVFLIAVGLAEWGLLYRSIESTRSRLENTETRLQLAENRARTSLDQIRAAEHRLGAAELRLLNTLSGFKTEQQEFFSAVRNRLFEDFTGLQTASEEHLSELSLQTEMAQRRIEDSARARVESLRDEIFSELTAEYDGLREREQEMIRTVSTRMAGIKTEKDDFKQVFLETRGAILFIRTEYDVELTTGETETSTAFGTGFLVSPVGVGMTAQHVLRPWLFDRKVRMLEKMGLLKVKPDSARVTMWMTDSRVTDEGGTPREFHPENGYRMDADHNEIRILHVAEVETEEELVASPLGPVEITVPKLGEGDLLIFQILDFSRRFPALTLSRSVNGTASLDEIMVLGYPLSRLHGGIASPQPSRGRVRRVAQGLLELDSPLHQGNSGGPILDHNGVAVGLASAILDSPVYGVAVRAEELQKAWEKVRVAIRAEQQHLKELGCDPGPVDGVPGKRTWEARQCAQVVQANSPQRTSQL